MTLSDTQKRGPIVLIDLNLLYFEHRIKQIGQNHSMIIAAIIHNNWPVAFTSWVQICSQIVLLGLIVDVFN